jgi:hypothetical protein
VQLWLLLKSVSFVVAIGFLGVLLLLLRETNVDVSSLHVCVASRHKHTTGVVWPLILKKGNNKKEFCHVERFEIRFFRVCIGTSISQCFFLVFVRFSVALFRLSWWFPRDTPSCQSSHNLLFFSAHSVVSFCYLTCPQ